MSKSTTEFPSTPSASSTYDVLNVGNKDSNQIQISYSLLALKRSSAISHSWFTLTLPTCRRHLGVVNPSSSSFVKGPKIKCGTCADQFCNLLDSDSSLVLNSSSNLVFALHLPMGKLHLRTDVEE